MNLYLKYRPERIEDVVGNGDVLNYVQSYLNDPSSIPQVLLFHGPTGCGKTTLARIISSALKCGEGDFVEINSANFRGIDTVRDLIKASRFHPIGGGNRVWLIDEVHKMTTDAQNAMLKPLEDTPKKTYFILCTTDPDKLLKTIRSRCIDLPMTVLSEEEMFTLLRSIVKKEGARVAKVVYTAIIQDSLGHPRNAIQILERVLQSPADTQLKVARQVASQQSKSIELCRALMGGVGWKKVSMILKGLKDQDPESIRRHVLGYAQSIVLNGQNDAAAEIIAAFFEPLYNVGFPGLVLYCYDVVKS